MAKPQLEALHITPAKNGGHTVRHQYRKSPVMNKGALSGGLAMSYPEPEEHAFGANQDAKLLAHVKSALGLKSGGNNAESE